MSNRPTIKVKLHCYLPVYRTWDLVCIWCFYRGFAPTQLVSKHVLRKLLLPPCWYQTQNTRHTKQTVLCINKWSPLCISGIHTLVQLPVKWQYVSAQNQGPMNFQITKIYINMNWYNMNCRFKFHKTHSIKIAFPFTRNYSYFT